MNDRELTEMMREGFSHGAGTRTPASRWNEIAAGLGQPVKVKRPRWGMAAAAAVLALLLSSLLYPPVMAATNSVLRNLFHTIWEGDVGGRPTTVFTLPQRTEDEDAPGVSPPSLPELPDPVLEVVTVTSVAQAAARAGFTPPVIDHERVSLENIRVDSYLLPPSGAYTIDQRYRWGHETYSLAAMAIFLVNEDGQRSLTPAGDLNTYLLPDEQLSAAPYVISLGETEALCLDRDFGHGSMNTNTHCTWVVDGIQIHLSGLDRERVIALAEAVVWP